MVNDSRIFEPVRAGELVGQYLTSLQAGEAPPDLIEDVLNAIDPLVNVIAPHYSTDFEIDDIRQEVRIHLLSALPSFNGDQNSLKPWLGAIIRNKAISLWRARHLREPSPMLELNEDWIEADNDPEPDIDGILEQIDLVNKYLEVRYPEIESDILNECAHLAVTSLADDLSTRATIKLMRERVEPPLRCNQVTNIYDSITVFLRLLTLKHEYLESPDFDLMEWSLYPELQLVLGDTLSKIIYTLFRGTYIHVRVKP